MCAVDVGGGEFFGADLEQKRRRTIDERRRLTDGRRAAFVLRHSSFVIRQQRILQLLPLLEVGLGDLAGQAAHAAESGLALRDADGAACVEDVEGMRHLQDVVVRGQHEAAREAGLGLGVVAVVQGAQPLDVGDFEVVRALLALVEQIDVAVLDAGRPLDVAEVVDLLQRDGDALEAVGQFDRHRVEREAARLLEVRELRDLLAVEPDLPAEAPRAERRALPVVLDEADVVLARVDAERLERLQVELLRVAGIRLEDDLVLVVLLQAVGVVAVAAVVGPDRRLDIGDVPRLRPEHAQHGARVHRTGADLGVMRLPDQATALGPELLERQDDGLEGQR